MKDIWEILKIEKTDRSLIGTIIIVIIIVAGVLAQLADLIQFYFYSRTLIPHLAPILVILFGIALIISVSIIYKFHRKYELKKNQEHSKKNLSSIIENEIINYLRKHKTIDIYEANLQTTCPGGILPADIKLADLAESPQYTINWNMIILKNDEKKDWIQRWRKEIQSRNPRTQQTVKVYCIDSKGFENFPLFNLFVVPQLEITFIGFGDYPHAGVDGGGILIRDKETAEELRKMVEYWMKKSKLVNPEQYVNEYGGERK